MLTKQIPYWKPSIILFFLTMIGTIFSGCRDTFYSLQLFNDGNERISDSRIVYGDRTLEFGSIAPRSLRAYGTVKLPIPASATFQWQYDSGKLCRKSVVVKDLITNAPSFDGWITAHLNTNGEVTIKITREEK